MKPPLRLATPGSISSRTLRPVDLLSAFLSTLEGLVMVNGHFYSLPENFNERDRLANLVGEAQDAFTADDQDVEDNESCFWILERLEDTLSQFAPENHYFGAHPGDGADFGFWPMESDDNE